MSRRGPERTGSWDRDPGGRGRQKPRECFRGWGSRPGIWWPIKTLSPGSWQDYYTWRGLSLDSPMAVLLTYPLTVYYVITHLVPQSCKECRQDWRVWGAGVAVREPIFFLINSLLTSS